MNTSLELCYGILLDERHHLGLREIEDLCDVTQPLIEEMVQEGLLMPSGSAPADWLFTGPQVRRVRRAVRLMRDLELNLPATALVMDLLEELEWLRARTRDLEYQLDLRARNFGPSDI